MAIGEPIIRAVSKSPQTFEFTTMGAIALGVLFGVLTPVSLSTIKNQERRAVPFVQRKNMRDTTRANLHNIFKQGLHEAKKREISREEIYDYMLKLVEHEAQLNMKTAQEIYHKYMPDFV